MELADDSVIMREIANELLKALKKKKQTKLHNLADSLKPCACMKTNIAPAYCVQSDQTSAETIHTHFFLPTHLKYCYKKKKKKKTQLNLSNSSF